MTESTPTTVDTTIPTVDPTEPTGTSTPPAPALTPDQAAQFAAFQQWQTQQAAIVPPAPATPPPPPPVHDTGLVTKLADDVESFFTKSGIRVHTENGDTIAVTPDGSQVTVAKDVYETAKAVAQLFNL